MEDHSTRKGRNQNYIQIGGRFESFMCSELDFRQKPKIIPCPVELRASEGEACFFKPLPSTRKQPAPKCYPEVHPYHHIPDRLPCCQGHYQFLAVAFLRVSKNLDTELSVLPVLNIRMEIKTLNLIISTSLSDLLHSPVIVSSMQSVQLYGADLIASQ